MKVEQVLSMKSKDEACFIIKANCIQCRSFCQDKYGSWNCNVPWNEAFCRKEYESFLNKIMDINTNGKNAQFR